MAITITSLSEPTTTGVDVYFTADSHWSGWNRAATVVVPDEGSDSWTMGWYPSEPSQRVRLTSLTPGTDYTVKIEKRSGSPGNYTYEYSNIESFSIVGPPGKATTPTPTDDQEDIKITGKDQLKKLQWEAPA